ncbi:hypothetical protein ACFPOD_00295 [Nitratireductor kimnyeongensis]|uniref:DUF4149 domain-containing protein n=1 Tax=Nitratireductor kimnyeongensis TaxID=430679 RepID=A0ABW0T4J4_9HYPH|nr:hypothetical protein [Nitratireductor kimnyeongensis]QZZ35402.1 hypothetical protein KW403_16900 [Nitratireductor kimnyeongensis]
MNRTFSILLSVYWAVIFGLAVWTAAQAEGIVVPVGSLAAETAWRMTTFLGHLGIVLGNALVAALFTWTLVVSVLENGDRRETANVAAVACAAALVMLLADLLHTGLSASAAAVPLSTATTMKFLAVLASHLVLRREGEAAEQANAEPAPPAMSRVNTLQIIDAAHDAMARRVAQRQRLRFSTPANDHWSP